MEEIRSFTVVCGMDTLEVMPVIWGDEIQIIVYVLPRDTDCDWRNLSQDELKEMFKRDMNKQCILQLEDANLEKLTRALVEMAMERACNNRRRAAIDLGIDVRTLQKYLRQYQNQDRIARQKELQKKTKQSPDSSG